MNVTPTPTPASASDDQAFTAPRAIRAVTSLAVLFAGLVAVATMLLSGCTRTPPSTPKISVPATIQAPVPVSIDALCSTAQGYINARINPGAIPTDRINFMKVEADRASTPGKVHGAFYDFYGAWKLGSIPSTGIGSLSAITDACIAHGWGPLRRS